MIKVLTFSASWCGPCKFLAPVLTKLAVKYEDLEFEKIDVDENKELTQKHSIQSVPTVIIFKDGDIVNRLSGPNEKSLTEAIDKAILQ